MIREEGGKKERVGGVGGPFAARQQTFSVMPTTSVGGCERPARDELGKMCFLPLVGLVRFDGCLRNFNVSLKRRGRLLPGKQKWHCQRERERTDRRLPAKDAMMKRHNIVS